MPAGPGGRVVLIGELDEFAMDNEQQGHVWYFVAAFMVLVLAQSWFFQASDPERIPNSTFHVHPEADRIARAARRAEQIERRHREYADRRTRFATAVVPQALTARPGRVAAA